MIFEIESIEPFEFDINELLGLDSDEDLLKEELIRDIREELISGIKEDLYTLIGKSETNLEKLILDEESSKNKTDIRNRIEYSYGVIDGLFKALILMKDYEEDC